MSARGTAALRRVAREFCWIDDSSRRESKQLHAEREMRRLEGRGGAREEKSSKIAITRILKACRSV